MAKMRLIGKKDVRYTSKTTGETIEGIEMYFIKRAAISDAGTVHGFITPDPMFIKGDAVYALPDLKLGFVYNVEHEIRGRGDNKFAVLSEFEELPEEKMDIEGWFKTSAASPLGGIAKSSAVTS